MQNTLPDPTSLRCFVSAADAPSFRAAAGRVGLSPAAFSERIRRLEEELGAELFHRTTRSVRLTEAGHRVLPAARQLLVDAAALPGLATDAIAPLPWELTLGTRFELGLSWLCPALGPLREAHPERTIHLFMGDSPDLLARVERGDVDAVVISARLTSPRLVYATLHPETYAFVATDPRVTEPAAVGGITLLDVSPDLPLFRYLLDALPDAEPWEFARHEYLGGIGGVRYRCLQGAGVAVLPEYFIEGDLQAGRLVRLLPQLPLHADAFRLVWRRGHPREEQLRALAQELRACPISAPRWCGASPLRRGGG